MKFMKIPVKNLDYVELYAEKLREDNSLFEQQRELIETQMGSSIYVFGNKFGKGENFKKAAREYLKKIGLIKEAEVL